MTLYTVKPAFQQALSPASRFAIRHAISADQLTLAAVALSVVGGAALALARFEPLLLLVALPVVLGRLALNALDGMVARQARTARPAGELLNEVGDRLGDLALVGGLVASGIGDLRLGMLALVAMLLPSAVGVAARAAGGARRYEGPLSKPDRMAVLAAAAVLTLAFPPAPVLDGALAIVAIGSALTAAIRYRAAHRALSQPPAVIR
jgi:CDP-diacylglycerol--glycerol-3-phosphate 3-phosphatidyltransferase